MRTKLHTRPARGRIREIWSEIDYAQRRMFELRTGIPTRETSRRRQIEMLETLYREGRR